MPQPAPSDEHHGYKSLLLKRRDLWRTRGSIADPALHGEFATLARINNKVQGYAWVRGLGLPTVAHHLYPSIVEALQETRRDRFVIKPQAGHSSAGVYLLTRNGHGGYACAMTGRSYSSDEELISVYREAQANPQVQISERVIVEDYVEDSLGYDVPLDYKVYAFATGTPIVMQRYASMHVPKSDWGFAFYDQSGASLGPIRLKVPSGERWNLRPPPDLDEIFALSGAIVQEAKISFVRIDLYSTPTGPVFGEFTPVPNNGREEYAPPYDRLLGDIWRQSLESLGLDYFSGLGR